MFETLRPMPVRPKRTWLTLSASAIGHSVAIVAIVGISLLASRHQPAPEHIEAFVLPPGPALPPPPKGTPQPSQPRPEVQPAPKPEPIDTTAASTTVSEPPPPTTASVAVSGSAAGVPTGVAGGTDITGVVGAAPPSEPVKVGGAIAAPALIKKTPPVYPSAARAARIEGAVVLEAHVSQTGEIEAVNIVKSGGLLDQAALTAVKQWRYKPLLLNGQPTPFIVDVTVSFNIG